MLRNLCLFTAVLLTVMITACVPTVPPRPELSNPLPTLQEKYSRLFFFSGQLFSNIFDLDLNKSGTAGEVFVNGEKISNINKREYIVVDVLSGEHEVSWRPIMNDFELKRRQSVVVSKFFEGGKTYYLSTNIRGANSKAFMLFGNLGTALSTEAAFIDTVEFESSLSETSERLVDYKRID